MLQDSLDQAALCRKGSERHLTELKSVDLKRRGTVDEKYRVLIASSIYPPQIGGPAIQADLFARALSRHGVDVRVLTYGPPSQVKHSVQVEYLDHRGGRGPLAAARRHFRIARQVSRLLTEFRPHAVQMQTAGGLFPLTVGIFARLHRIPSWLKFAGDPVLETVSRQQSSSAGKTGKSWTRRVRVAVTKLFARLAFRAYRYIWVTTPAVAEELRSRWAISRDRIVVEPNLVDLGDLTAVARPRTDRDVAAPLRLLLVTRLDPIKGVDVAIRALAEMNGGSAVLRIVGEGASAYVEHLHSIAEELGVSDRIEWAGPIAREKLTEEYRNADILLVPSHYETFGVVIVEALAAGLPVIASNVGGVPNVVDGRRYARLVQPGDPAALARAMVELAGNPAEMARLSREGPSRAREFDAEAGVERWLQIFHASAPGAVRPLALCSTVKD